MANTVSQAFSEFQQNLEPTETDRDKIIRRHDFIRARLRGKIINDGRIPDFLIGSYVRHTQIRPVNDVDIMVVFDSDSYRERYASTPQNFLRYLKLKLREIFPETKLRTQPHSIGLKFTQSPDVDIVPAFLEDYENEVFVIPDKDFIEYIETSPKQHQRIITEHNQFLQNKFMRIVKMLKKWRDYNEIELKSFHLEIFTMNVLNRPFINYQGGLLYFFTNASNQIFDRCDDPTQLSGYLDSYLDYESKKRLSKIFHSTSQKIKELNRLEASGKHQEAIAEWRKIFGPPFPKSETRVPNTYSGKRKTDFPPNGKTYTFGVE